jgi:ubiquitin-conjugating enzyme E2 variant
LNKLGFYRHSERLITWVTGAIPRRDDIGIEAALAIAPAVASSADATVSKPQVQ